MSNKSTNNIYYSIANVLYGDFELLFFFCSYWVEAKLVKREFRFIGGVYELPEKLEYVFSDSYDERRSPDL